MDVEDRMKRIEPFWKSLSRDERVEMMTLSVKAVKAQAKIVAKRAAEEADGMANYESFTWKLPDVCEIPPCTLQQILACMNVKFVLYCAPTARTTLLPSTPDHANARLLMQHVAVQLCLPGNRW